MANVSIEKMVVFDNKSQRLFFSTYEAYVTLALVNKTGDPRAMVTIMDYYSTIKSFIIIISKF